MSDKDREPAGNANIPQESQLSADRHLLFGLLALQNGMVAREQLVAAFAKWTSDKSQGIDELLLKEDGLSRSRCELLHQLVEVHVQKHDGDVQRTIGTMAGGDVYATKVELEMLNDTDLSRSITRLPNDNRTIAPTIGRPTDEGGRFRILRPLDGGQGGMGEISIAEDSELGRSVALKQIRKDHADREVYRNKFVVEAEITGNLEHPGIVPVYGLGKDASGRPYYAMRLVEGDDLGCAIESFHERRAKSEVGYDSVEFRNLIDRLIDVAQAISYAHSRGVLHRDLKPGNVLVGNFGETLVIDWGLARVPQGELSKSTAPAPVESTDPPVELRVRSGSVVDPTVHGSIMGTPGYAPPEQVQGNVDQVGKASDVYGLGAILYQILVGKTTIPVKGRHLSEAITDIVRGHIQPPRKQIPGVPKPLEAICLKSLATKPSDRYQSVEELIGELQRWKADQPIVARRDTLIERGARFARKHRSAAMASAAALLVISLVAAVAVFFVDQQRRIALSERKNAEGLAEIASHERDKAERRKDQALRQVVKLDLATAKLHSAQNNTSAVLHWLIKAWEDDLGRISEKESLSDSRDANHRFRIGSAIQKINGRLVGFCPHDRPLINADCNDTGKRVVSLVGDNLARVWLADQAKLAYAPLEHSKKVNSALFSASRNSGRPQERIVTSSDDGTARIWDADSGKLLNTFHCDNAVKRAVISPDGKWLAAASGEQVLQWEIETGELRCEPLTPGGAVVYVAYNRTGSYLLSQTDGEQGHAQVWKAADGEPVSSPILSPRYKQPPDSNFDILGAFENLRWPRFSPDGRMLAVADGFHIQVWSPDELKKHKVNSVSKAKQIEAWFDSRNRYLYFVQRRGFSLGRIDLSTGRVSLLGRTPRLTTGVRLSPDGKWAAVSISQGNVKLHRLPDTARRAYADRSREFTELPASDNLTQFQFTKDSRRLMTVSGDGTVRIWQIPREYGYAGLEPYKFDCGRAHLFASSIRRRTPDGVWEAEKRRDGIRVRRVGSDQETLLPGTGDTLGFQFTARSKLVLSRKDSVEVWSVTNDGKAVRDGVLEDRKVVKLSLSHDGKRMATLCLTGEKPASAGALGDQIEVWELPTLRKLIGPLGVNVPRIVGVVLNRDGSLVLAEQTGSAGPPCWDVASGKRLPEIKLRSGDGKPSFGEQDDRIVVAMSSYETYQWDVRKGLPGGPTILKSGGDAIYSPDQTKILVHFFGRGKLLDAKTGEELVSFNQRFGSSIAWFSSDGQRILFMSGTNDAVSWNLPSYDCRFEHVKPLVELLTGTTRDSLGGVASLEENVFLKRGEIYRKAFQAWKGVID